MDRTFKGLDDFLGYFNNSLGIKIGVNETDKKEVGASFEPRTQTRYEVKLDDKIIGHYEHTDVFEKDGKTKITEFGRFLKI